MTKTSRTIVFFGNERIATGVQTDTPILRSLIRAGYNISAVVSHHEHTRSRNARELEIAQVAAEHNIPLLLPDKLKDIAETLESYDAEAGVLIAYGKIIPQSVIDIFPRGIINIHPSLLPKHRGPTPLESVILDGSAETGVSIMALAKEMDAGDIYAQSDIPLSGHETKQELANTLLDVGVAMLQELLPGILDGSVVAMPQDDRAATYDQKINKQDGILDFTKPALRLEREIRAFSAWPGSRTKLGDMEVTVTAGYAMAGMTDTPGTIEVYKETNGLRIQSSEGFLCIDRLKPAGKKEMTAKEFILGYGQRIDGKVASA